MKNIKTILASVTLAAILVVTIPQPAQASVGGYAKALKLGYNIAKKLHDSIKPLDAMEKILSILSSGWALLFSGDIDKAEEKFTEADQQIDNTKDLELLDISGTDMNTSKATAVAAIQCQNITNQISEARQKKTKYKLEDRYQQWCLNNGSSKLSKYLVNHVNEIQNLNSKIDYCKYQIRDYYDCLANESPKFGGKKNIAEALLTNCKKEYKAIEDCSNN